MDAMIHPCPKFVFVLSVSNRKLSGMNLRNMSRNGWASGGAYMCKHEYEMVIANILTINFYS